MLNELLKQIDFKNKDDFKSYMKEKAKLNEYGAVCYTEKRNGYELNYSDNCKNKWGIGGNIKGIFQDYRFN